MKTYQFIVLTNPIDGQDDAFNDWYDNRHVPDVLNVPGFIAAQRFKVLDPQGPGWRYLAIYEFQSDDPKATVAELSARAGTDAMVMSDALDRSGLSAFVVEAITARRTK